MAPRVNTVETYNRLIDEVRKGRIDPLYFLAGTERLLMDRLVSALRKAVLDEGLAEFNHDQVLASETDMGQVIQLARTVPMMGGRRLVEVRDAEQLSAADLERLLPYLERPVETTVLVFTASKLDGRLKASRALDRAGCLARFEPVRGAPLLRFLESEARRLKARLAPGVAELLVELVGTDFLALANAVEKLALYAGEGGEVSAAQVDEVVSRTRQAVIFELTDAVGEGNTRAALTSLRSLLEAGEPEQRVLFMIARQFRQIWQATEALNRGGGPSEVAAALGGVPPFVARKIIAQARRFDLPGLHEAHQEIYRTDRALKTARLPRDLLLERLILGLCSRRRASPSRPGR